MAVARDPDPLDRATQALRRQRAQAADEAWREVSARVRVTLRDLALPGRLVRSHVSAPPGGDGSTTRVAERVLRQELRRAVASPVAALDGVRLGVDEDDELREVHVTVVAAYGTDLRALGEAVRSEVEAALRLLLGQPPGAVRVVQVEVVDVVAGDPRRT